MASKAQKHSLDKRRSIPSKALSSPILSLSTGTPTISKNISKLSFKLSETRILLSKKLLNNACWLFQEWNKSIALAKNCPLPFLEYTRLLLTTRESLETSKTLVWRIKDKIQWKANQKMLRSIINHSSRLIRQRHSLRNLLVKRPLTNRLLLNESRKLEEIHRRPDYSRQRTINHSRRKWKNLIILTRKDRWVNLHSKPKKFLPKSRMINPIVFVQLLWPSKLRKSRTY